MDRRFFLKGLTGILAVGAAPAVLKVVEAKVWVPKYKTVADVTEYFDQRITDCCTCKGSAADQDTTTAKAIEDLCLEENRLREQMASLWQQRVLENIGLPKSTRTSRLMVITEPIDHRDAQRALRKQERARMRK